MDLKEPLSKMHGPVASCAAGATPVLDARLAAALRCLEADTSSAAVARTAGVVGLSTSRLRALSIQELGTPLASWVLWRKLERAGKNLMGGAGFAAAAHGAGFADQAHFTRTMRKVFGITSRMLSLSTR